MPWFLGGEGGSVSLLAGMLRWEAWELRVWTRLQASRENGLWGVQAAPLRHFEVVLERVVVQISVQQWGWEDDLIGY